MERHILLVEDDPVNQAAAIGILEARADWKVTQAEDGQIALDLLTGGYRPDLLLLDVRMPRMDGLELAQKIRADAQLRHLRIIVTSGNRDKETILAFARVGVSGFLPKPYAADKTLALLESLLTPKT